MENVYLVTESYRLVPIFLTSQWIINWSQRALAEYTTKARCWHEQTDRLIA